MKILSMTATFGKLNQQTIQFDDGLNVVHAPNEWGKSTWCAFVTAMFYGIETRKSSSDTVLADKDHYKPWSGAPMAGRMDILWNGRKITIERTSKSRGFLNQFRAYETDTGAAVPELQAETCGQVLLGVEKEVFQRSAFLRLADLPVSDSPALRARLNSLVSTGDESGTAELLGEKLKELRNACRSNSKNGRLPEAERIQDELVAKLERRLSLQDRQKDLQAQLQQAEADSKALKNHQDALAYQENFTYHQKLTAAQTAAALVKADLEMLLADCQNLPSEETIRKELSLVRQYREEKESLSMQTQVRPTAPIAPVAPEVFRGMTGQKAVKKSTADKKAYDALKCRKPQFSVAVMAALLAAAIALAIIPGIGLFLIPLPLVGIGIYSLNYSKKAKVYQKDLDTLLSTYPGISPDRWIALAEAYRLQEEAYCKEKDAYEGQNAGFTAQLTQLQEKISRLTKGESLAQYEWQLQAALEKQNALGDKEREYSRSVEFMQALESSHKVSPPPAFPDALTLSAEETALRIRRNGELQSNLRQQLGQIQGQMDSLGSEEALTRELGQVRERIAKLKTYLKALETAMEVLEKARVELQKRFAPRISQKAQQYMERLTGGRYNQLALDGNFVLWTGTTEEIETRTALWRSEGTIDQLYLALRLAVSQELIPGAPMILDDALVRFDDTRMKAAMDLLKEEGENRQILLFSCQQREKEYTDGKDRNG